METVRDLNYSPEGIARRGAMAPEGLVLRERSVALGSGDDVWERAAVALSGWEIKKRVGFRVDPDGPVAPGQDVSLRFGIGRIRLLEPVRVIWVERSSALHGFAYGTRRGHPITGEEAFLVERHPDGSVHFTVRSVSRVSGGGWRLLSPLIRLAQPWFLRRYARAATTFAARRA